MRVRNRGEQIVAAAADRPLLETLEDAGLRLPFGCRYGACASCAARLVTGAVDYNDAWACALRPEQRERGFILLCVAHPRADCVIDVGVQKGLYRNPFAHKQPANPRA